jgi:hypothetical protein
MDYLEAGLKEEYFNGLPGGEYFNGLLGGWSQRGGF